VCRHLYCSTAVLKVIFYWNVCQGKFIQHRCHVLISACDVHVLNKTIGLWYVTDINENCVCSKMPGSLAVFFVIKVHLQHPNNEFYEIFVM